MISSPTHSAKVSIELSGYGDSYNELVIEFMLRMTDSGSPQTWDSPAEGPEFEIAGVEIAHHYGDEGEGGEAKEVNYKTLELILGEQFTSKLFDEACERAEE